MVLILLSTPNHNTPLWPSTPRSFDMSPLSPKTPLTPSPSFFAILSPIFTADDNVPASPAGLRQISPGMIPPETPPPWLIGSQSPTTPVRPVPSRSNSLYDAPTPTLARVPTSENLTPFRQRQRPVFPSTTYSFTAGHAQAFRPPPPLALKRTKTEPFRHVPSSPLRQALSNATHAVPELTVRPPSREQLKLRTDDLPVEQHVMSPVEIECMDIPIALEAPPSTPQTGAISDGLSRPLSRLQDLKHARSQSETITVSFRPRRSSSIHRPLELTTIRSPTLSMSFANLKRFDEENEIYFKSIHEHQ